MYRLLELTKLSLNILKLIKLNLRESIKHTVPINSPVRITLKLPAQGTSVLCLNRLLRGTPRRYPGTGVFLQGF